LNDLRETEVVFATPKRGEGSEGAKLSRTDLSFRDDARPLLRFLLKAGGDTSLGRGESGAKHPGAYGRQGKFTEKQNTLLTEIISGELEAEQVVKNARRQVGDRN